MFAVLWRTSALDSLADVYVGADAAERERIAAGVTELNRSLAINPLDVGESRAGHDRVAFPPLLNVLFRVEESTATVRVVGVKRYGR